MHKEILHNCADVLVDLYFYVILKCVCLGYFYENNKLKNK